MNGTSRGYGAADHSLPIECVGCGEEKPYNEIDWDEWSWERPAGSIDQLPYCPDCSDESESKHEI